MKNTALNLIPASERLRKLAGCLHRGRAQDLALLEVLIQDTKAMSTLDDPGLRDLILVVKHHRPDLALALLTHVRAPRERMSLGNCLAALWSRVDINAAWKAISTCSLPKAERLALHSVMM
ncbi:MAG: hypothetical protein V4662_20075 [Verrucomicrobiota bacterium]